MTLWFILVMMTVVALAAVAWPLARAHQPASGVSDVAVYRDQLEEIERDRADGRIGHDEFEAARVEVSRRLLGAASAAASLPAEASGQSFRVGAFAGAIIAIPLIAVPFYALLGSPGLPGEPLAARDAGTSIMTMIARIERHLEENPDDGKGWEVLAPVYLKLERYDDAAKARRNALKLLGDTAQREVDLGAALAMAAGGVVTAEAKGAFDRAAAIEPGNVQAMFFLGIAAQQDGNEAEAVSIWRDLIAKGPADAPWLPLVRERLARINAEAPPPAPGPTAEDVTAAQEMPNEARAQFIRTMVGRLASRLHEDGSDV
ncbi:MAG: c-type cytochrome biogenesis protein CcmI, partial [Bradyrhizobiaceae bacterium]|nr:c-type cytochrome biogenesis protein CcmI [Bradyrhizobiaceae bacterium]